ncbi:hypothetical protein ATANTOWER_018990 [Ataeniobius toweri]|uniref:Uncharacterized protein n=1 Tax=Ataeniobius toweri TaxID=208326 RepID=A0ABU7ABX1_9TELE|nr:hypothetical protein [Ataeniobius toweri]
MGELGPISSGHQTIGRVHPGQVTSPSQGSIETQSAVNHANTLIPQDNLERPKNLTVMLLDRGRKLEYLERTHVCTGRTCKPNAERAQVGIQTQELLAARCYHLCHCAAHRNNKRKCPVPSCSAPHGWAC